eukprot:12563421-Ditylum_brightwellii.AAC.1
MKSTLVCSCDNYYNYQDMMDELAINEIDAYTLAICTYKATFRVNMSIPYIFEITMNHFCSSTYKEIYQDDKL